MNRLLRWSIVLLSTALVTSEALARPGGGQMFGGGGGGDGLGGGGGDGSLEILVLRVLLWLIIEHPVIGVPTAILTIGLYAVYTRKTGDRVDWSAGLAVSRPLGGISVRARLEELRERDPDFSVVLFEDFLYALYAQAHRRRTDGAIDHLSAYLGSEARRSLKETGSDLRSVEGIIIGSMSFVGFSSQDGEDPRTVLEVVFETNYSEVKANGSKETYYSVEQWSLMRSLSARSRSPDRIAVFTCPNCGGAQSGMDEGTCGYCGEKVDTGAFDWAVSQIRVKERRVRPPKLPLHPHEEMDPGLSNPTVVYSGTEQRFRELCERDSGLTREVFDDRVKEVFHALQVAWSELQWEGARPFLTDRLYQSQVYWIEAYQRSGLRNVIENPEVTWIDLAAVSSDKWFDAVTVRVFAKSFDYTIETATGKVLGGNRKVRHGYSEYWTFVRGRMLQGPGDAGMCPNCGGELTITSGGTCKYCDARVSSGDFGWVLSRIEQDQAYK